MAWIVPIAPSPRYPYERYRVGYQDGKRQRSAGIFPTKRRALAEQRAIERGDRQQLPDPADLDPRKARMPFGEYVATKWWPAWKDQHPRSESGTERRSKAHPVAVGADRGRRRRCPGAGGGGPVLAATRGGDDLAHHDPVQGGLGPG